jgi:hypothetical protein
VGNEEKARQQIETEKAESRKHRPHPAWMTAYQSNPVPNPECAPRRGTGSLVLHPYDPKPCAAMMRIFARERNGGIGGPSRRELKWKVSL